MRIAHALDTYLKLDSDIIYDKEAASKVQESDDVTATHNLGPGNIIVIGSGNLFARKLLKVPQTERRTEFSISPEGDWLLRDEPILQAADGRSIGVLFTHPHPSNPRGLMLFMDGMDDAALERVLRLAAPRTGIAVPDWIIISEEADRKGMGGVIGAGSV